MSGRSNDFRNSIHGLVSTRPQRFKFFMDKNGINRTHHKEH